MGEASKYHPGPCFDGCPHRVVDTEIPCCTTDGDCCADDAEPDKEIDADAGEE